MGQTWHAPAGAPRPAHRMGLYLRRDLSREGEGCRAGHALVRHRRHGGAPHRDQCRRRSRRPCGADRRSGRLALDAQAGDPRQHHRPGAAATIARVEPGGECLATVGISDAVNEPASTLPDVHPHRKGHGRRHDRLSGRLAYHRDCDNDASGCAAVDPVPLTDSRSQDRIGSLTCSAPVTPMSRNRR